MARPKDDEAESQRKKYEHHKKANNTLKHYLEEGNYIGAYVIAYSLLEDRVRAMYVVVQRDVHKVVYTQNDINAPFARIVDYLQKNNHLTKELAKQLYKANDNRNTLLHDAMWELDVFKEKDVTTIGKLRDEVSSVLEKLKRVINKDKSKTETVRKIRIEPPNLDEVWNKD